MPMVFIECCNVTNSYGLYIPIVDVALRRLAVPCSHSPEPEWAEASIQKSVDGERKSFAC
jgi:hypothetical protein